MKKSYLKPDAEYVEFISTEAITDDIPDGEMGTSGLPEGWE